MPFCTNCGQPYTQPLKFCTACGAAIQPVVDMSPVAQPIIQPAVPAQPAPVQTTPARAEKLNTSKPAFNNKLPLLLIIVAGAAFAGYKFFFSPNPKKDGAATARMACNCNEIRTAEWPSSYNAFITASASRAFISNEEIIACIDSLASDAQAVYDSCSGEAKNAYVAAGKKYGDENNSLFTDAYLKSLNECRSKQADFNTLFSASRNEASQKLSGRIGRYQQPPAEVAVETALPPEAIKKEENQEPPVPANQSELVQQLSRFFEAENSISSVGDIDNALDYYSNPMRKNFSLYNVTRERLYKMYKAWYVVKYPYHKLYDYQGHIKEIPLADGRTRMEVTFKFETSGNADGSNSRLLTVSNAYIFNTDGKIESAGLATDKSL